MNAQKRLSIRVPLETAAIIAARAKNLGIPMQRYIAGALLERAAVDARDEQFLALAEALLEAQSTQFDELREAQIRQLAEMREQLAEALHAELNASAERLNQGLNKFAAWAENRWPAPTKTGQ